MAEHSPQRLRQRILGKAADKLGDKVGEWLFALLAGPVVIGWVVLARHWIANEWACINKPWCEVSGWSLGLLIFGALSIAAVLAVVGVRLHRTRRDLRAMRTAEAERIVTAEQGARVYRPPSQAFQRITVEDERLKLRWFIRRPPHEWLDWRNIARTVSPGAVHDALDGPFHAEPGCNAPLVEIPMKASLMGASSPQFAEECRHCRKRVFVGFRPGAAQFGVSAWPVRAQALEELQRMHLNNDAILAGRADLRPPIVLENPAYWTLMLPPREAGHSSSSTAS